MVVSRDSMSLRAVADVHASALTGQICHLSGHQALAAESRRTILSAICY